MKKCIELTLAIVFLGIWPVLIYAKPSPSIIQLVPNGWKIPSSNIGDLNKDKYLDIVMIIEKIKPDIILKDDKGKILNNTPRQL